MKKKFGWIMLAVVLLSLAMVLFFQNVGGLADGVSVALVIAAFSILIKADEISSKKVKGRR